MNREMSLTELEGKTPQEEFYSSALELHVCLYPLLLLKLKFVTVLSADVCMFIVSEEEEGNAPSEMLTV